jgi:signal transduction histidine kinase
VTMKTTRSTGIVLNVDDNDGVRYAKTRTLTLAGFTVIEAATGGEALERALQDAPDLVLLDVKLPDINGLEVCRRLKANRLTQHIMVLQTSAAYIGTIDKVRALEGGADNYLAEPIEPAELVANVKALLRLSRVERELREVDQRKDVFLATLAHELRNPLGPIRNSVALLQKLDPYVPPIQEKARQIIIRQTNHLVRLVDDLLDVSRITQGKITLRKEPVELQTFINAAIEISSPILETRRHRLTLNVPQESMWVSGDPVRLAQVFGNLLHNAAKFMAPDGRISINVKKADNGVRIEVADKGIGIADESIDSIFSLFSQAAHTKDSVQDGLGIGLSLVKTLVELHAGTVAASSPGVGLGSIFTVWLPLFNDGFESVSEVASVQAKDRCQRVLVVDDNQDAANTLGAWLEIGGHTVQIRYNGLDAIACMSIFQPEIVFLDIGLPDVTGYEVARKIRALVSGKNATLIALTGYGQESDKELTIEAGFDEHVVKPMSIEKFDELMAVR